MSSLSSQAADRRWDLVRRSLRWRPRTTALLVASGLAWQALEVAMPLAVATAIDRGLAVDNTGAALPWALVLIVVAAVSGAISGARNWLAKVNRARAEAMFRERVMDRLLELDARFHDRHARGDLLSRIVSDARHVAEPADFVGHASGYLAGIAGTAAALVILDPQLALVVLLPLPALALMACRYALRFGPRAERLQEARSRLLTSIDDAISGAEVIDGLGAQPAVRRRFESANADVVREGVGLGTLAAALTPWLVGVPPATMCAVLVLGGERVIDGSLSVGTLVAFGTYATTLSVPLVILGHDLRLLRQSVASAGRIAHVLDAEPAVRDTPRVTVARADAPSLELVGVRFGYDSRRPILTGVDLRVPPGRIVAVTGPTGAGKSTLLALLLRLYDADGGRVLLGGHDIRRLALHELRRQVAVAFQEPTMVGATVADDVRFFAPSIGDAELLSALRSAVAHELVSRLPAGAGAPVGEGAPSLSGGECQRIALARALAAPRPVVLLDEPTSALDLAHERAVASGLRKALVARTCVVVSRRPAVLAIADRVAMLDGGRIVDQGRHADLMERSPQYLALISGETPS